MEPPPNFRRREWEGRARLLAPEVVRRYATGETGEAIAGALGISRSALLRICRWMTAAGMDPRSLAPPRVSKAKKRRYVSAAPRSRIRAPWTREEKVYLASYYGRVSPLRIARRFGRSVGSVHQQAHKQRTRCKDNLEHSAAELGRALGVSTGAVTRWLAKGWLEGRRAGFRHGRAKPWSVSDEQLEAFLNARPWLLDPARMPAGYWREVVERGGWLTLRDASQRLAYAPCVVGRWIAEGLLRGETRGRPSVAGGREWMVRWPDAQEAAKTHAQRVVANQRRVMGRMIAMRWPNSPAAAAAGRALANTPPAVSIGERA